MDNLLSRLIIVAAILLVGIPVLSGVVAYVWNKKYVPAQLAKGKVVRSFGKWMSEIHKFTFKEDTATLAKKAPPVVRKILSLRSIHFILITVGVVGTVLTGNWFFLLALPVSFCLGVGRAVPVIHSRQKILDRIFAIASSSIKFSTGARGKNVAPPASWNHINVEKWNGETPAKMVITFPPGAGPERGAQKAFEQSFESMVTDENIWVYEWDLPHDRVTIEAAPHLPTQLPYPGSEKEKWSVFPVGESAGGVASYDVSVFPHVLVGGPSGTGKMLSLETPVLTANKGWVTVKNLEVGDELFSIDGTTTKVTHLHPVVTPQEVYKVTFKNGDSILADANHLWETETRSARWSRKHAENHEPNRLRRTRLTEQQIAKITAELSNTKNTDTISIPELAELLGVEPTTGFLHDFAKQVGPAEQVTKTVIQHYGAQVVKQKQPVTRVPFNFFVSYYNNRGENTPTLRKPLLREHYDKLEQLVSELRPTDTLTVESIIEYVDATHKTSVDWFKQNTDTTLDAVSMVKDLQTKAAGNYSILPAQILTPVEEQVGMVSKHDMAGLLGVKVTDIEPVWSVAVRKAPVKQTQKETVELLVSAKQVEKKSPPFFTYPKKLILQRLLDNNIILWDQRNKSVAGRSVRTTKEIFQTQQTKQDGVNQANHFIRRSEPVELPETTLPVHPYLLGAWLGDGNSRRGEICGVDKEIFTRITELGYEGTLRKNNRENKELQTVYYPQLHAELKQQGWLVPASHKVRETGEMKHIPAQYFLGSVEQRRELLRGLMDTDGSVSRNTGTVVFHTSNKTLAKDVFRLVSSLGYIPYLTSKTPTFTHLGVKKTGKRAWNVSFQADPTDRIFHLRRKNETHQETFNPRNLLEDTAHVIVKVEQVETEPMRCVSVDSPDRLFLVSDSLIPTHNSVLQRNIVFHTIQHNDRWRFLGIDLKRVELTPYNKYKKTVMGIATDVEQGLEVLKYAYNEMMDRYKLMESIGVNNVMDMPDPPYCILLMIDEATMFLGASGSKTEEGKAEDAMKAEASDLVGKILRLGRAAGIHMLVAMQRPDATVLRGEFKANMDVRLAAGRMDSTPSSMILDSGEAVNLPGIKGRGLIRVGGNLTVFQGYFAPQDWIDEYILKHPEVEPSCVAPGGHLYEKYQALLATQGQNQSNNEAENSETEPVPAPAPATTAVAELPPAEEDLPEGQRNLLEALNKKPEDNVPDASQRSVPSFFTGSASKEEPQEEPVVRKEIEPELADKDYLLDDFEDLDTILKTPEEPQPEEETPEPAVKWKPVSPFGQPAKPEPVQSTTPPNGANAVTSPPKLPTKPAPPFKPVSSPFNPVNRNNS